MSCVILSRRISRGASSVMHMIDEINGELNVGDQIRCIIDSEWRNQLSAMHTAQHLISALANEEWGADTVGNQIGKEKSRIDFQPLRLSLNEIDDIIDQVNEYITKDLPVLEYA